MAAQTVSATPWFRTDINDQYGWLFEPACLEYDGWTRIGFNYTDGRKGKSWANADPGLPI